MPLAPVPHAAEDVFAAIAEPRRRRMLDLLARGQPMPVNDLVEEMRLPQPSVSKHLGVLRRAGVVSVERSGRLRLYRLEASRLKAVRDWVAPYEKFWSHQLDRIKENAEKAAAERSVGGGHWIAAAAAASNNVKEERRAVRPPR